MDVFRIDVYRTKVMLGRVKDALNIGLGGQDMLYALLNGYYAGLKEGGYFRAAKDEEVALATVDKWVNIRPLENGHGETAGQVRGKGGEAVMPDIARGGLSSGGLVHYWESEAKRRSGLTVRSERAAAPALKDADLPAGYEKVMLIAALAGLRYSEVFVFGGAAGRQAKADVPINVDLARAAAGGVRCLPRIRERIYGSGEGRRTLNFARQAEGDAVSRRIFRTVKALDNIAQTGANLTVADLAARRPGLEGLSADGLQEIARVLRNVRDSYRKGDYPASPEQLRIFEYIMGIPVENLYPPVYDIGLNWAKDGLIPAEDALIELSSIDAGKKDFLRKWCLSRGAEAVKVNRGYAVLLHSPSGKYGFVSFGTDGTAVCSDFGYSYIFGLKDYMVLERDGAAERVPHSELKRLHNVRCEQWREREERYSVRRAEPVSQEVRNMLARTLAGAAAGGVFYEYDPEEGEVRVLNPVELHESYTARIMPTDIPGCTALTRFGNGRVYYGAVTESGLIPPRYDDIPLSGDGVMYRVNSGGIYGYCNASGAEVIPAGYKGAELFSEGAAPVEDSRGWLYIREDGSELFRLDAGTAGYAFSQGLATVRADTGREGAVDRQGRQVIEPCLERLYAFAEGLAVFREQGLYGYISVTGERLCGAVYEEAGSFRGGFARAVHKGKTVTLAYRNGRITHI